MPINYLTIFRCCTQKCDELGIVFDFENNAHLQHPTTMNDIYKNFVYHSQNRSQGCAFNFFDAIENGQEDLAERIWNIIEGYTFNLDDNYDYINLFNRLKQCEFVNSNFDLEKGKDIQYLELAKTCQCIRKYLNRYSTLEEFVGNHLFSNNAAGNWRIVQRVAKAVYNMSTTLTLDFFKEQDCIRGREFLIKPDIHVNRFFRNIYDKKKMSDKQVYDALLNLYNGADRQTQQNVSPYKVDKLIYLIGKHFGDPALSKEFADWVLSCC